jgi:hypothetical protein
MNLKDGRALTAPAEDIDTRLDELTKAAARRVIAANATGADLDEMITDATELMMMLGVHPAQHDEDFLSSEEPFISCRRAGSRA